MPKTKKNGIKRFPADCRVMVNFLFSYAASCRSSHWHERLLINYKMATRTLSIRIIITIFWPYRFIIIISSFFPSSLQLSEETANFANQPERLSPPMSGQNVGNINSQSSDDARAGAPCKMSSPLISVVIDCDTQLSPENTITTSS